MKDSTIIRGTTEPDMASVFNAPKKGRTPVVPFADTTETAVKAVFYKWCEAIALADGKGHLITKFYAPQALLLPTLARDILHLEDGAIEAYFDRLTSFKGIHCSPEKLLTRVLKEDVAVNSGVYHFIYFDEKGEKQTLTARYNFIYQKIDGRWLIVNHHSSVLPN